MLGGEHVYMDFFDLLFLIEVSYDCLRTQSDWFVCVDLSACDLWGLDLHSLGWPSGLLSQTLTMSLLYSSLFLMISWPSQSWIGIMRDCEHILAHLKSQALIQSRVRVEGLIEVDLQNRVSGNIGCLLIKSTMYVHIVFDHEADVSETINVRQFVPIWGIGIIDVERHGFAYLVATASDDHEESADEETAMLVTLGGFGIVAIGGSHPVESSISMFS